MESVAKTTTTSFTSGLSMSVTNRWAGMIEQSVYKKTRNTLFQLTSYVYIECPPMFILHEIISIFRLLQFIGPALFVPFKNIWPNGSISQTLMNLLSVFFHIFPSSVREECALPFLIVYAVLLAVFFIFVLASGFYYKQNAKLPNWIPIVIYIFLNSFGYLLHPIGFQLGGELLGKIIYGRHTTQIGPSIAVLCFGIIMFLVYLWLMTTVTSTSILFNPCSLITVIGKPQMLIFLFTNVITFLTAIASECSDIPRYILVSISALIYAGSTLVPFSEGGFVSNLHTNMIIADGISGAILCIGCIVLNVINVEGNEVAIFIIIALWVVSYLVASTISSARRKRSLAILDAIEEDKENFDYLRKPSQFYEIVVTGFANAHPVCISWDVFQSAVEKWPENVNIWVLYTKFAVIYPEESQKVGWIQHQMMSLHLKGATSKHIQEEIITMLRMRESNISPELKKKLNKINKKVQLVKHKLRHIWDLVIQGNTGDMGTFIDKTYDAVLESEAEYNHLLSQYPNSRFVTRSFARFQLEVMANHEAFNEWAEKAKLLQRGIPVSKDHAHELGLTYFPCLPQTVSKLGDSATIGQTQIDSESQLLDMEDSDDRSQSLIEQSIALRKQIEELRIPGTFKASIHRILIAAILFLVVVIIATVLIYQVESDFSAPLTYLHHVSMLRTHVFLTTSYGLHYIQQKLEGVKTRQDVISDDAEAPPSSLGNTWNLNLQFSYLLNQLTLAVKELGGLRTIAPDNEHMSIARNKVFGSSVNYTHFASTTSSTSNPTSVTVSVMDIVTQLSNLLASETIDNTIYSSSKIVNPTYNANEVADSVSDALSNISKYMNDNHTYLLKVFFYLRIVFLIAFPIFLLVVLYIEIREIGNDKIVISKCLTSLPKNVVSTVADSLKMMKGEQSECSSRTEQDSEMNKQEENMLKIFATASDSSSSRFSDSLLMIICTLLTIALAVLLILEIYSMFTTISSNIYGAAPHVNNLMGAYAYQCSMLMMLSIIASENNGNNIHASDSKEILTKLPTVLSKSLEYYHTARFGKEDGSESPFEEFHTGVVRQDSLYKCDESSLEPPKTMRDAYECLSLEMLYFTVESFIDTLIVPMKEKDEKFLPTDEMMWNLWEIETTFMFDRYFHPIFSGIIDSVESSLSSEIATSLILCYLIFVGEVIVELVVIYNCNLEQSKLRFALKLLLHCQPSTITQIPLITNVLSGNFKLPKGDAAQRNKLFFDEVLGQLPDPLIITDESGTITSVNTQGKRMFQIENIIGMKMVDFMNLPNFENSIDLIRKQAPQEEDITFVDQTNTRFNLNVKTLAFNQMTAYMIRDITQTVRYNTLIAEERSKSDKLLESILPAKLVRRVQQGEKNISFSVQSASVVFMDIVSFTPWCGSLPANRVMEILNRLYKEFDALVAKYPTITKIKCIGDCYMAAGGIFSEMNQPAVHAKEMVEFGLDALSAVQIVNGETGQELRIRVGINTGGPLVAGVLGSGKPTFEILGPTINMAQQMEHHGVPMQVHISRAVYELIYGGDFKIKERGQIEIKNGTVVTYLVSP